MKVYLLRLTTFLNAERLRRFKSDLALQNTSTTIDGLGGGKSLWLFRILINCEATWSTVTPKTGSTVNLSVNFITV